MQASHLDKRRAWPGPWSPTVDHLHLSFCSSGLPFSLCSVGKVFSFRFRGPLRAKSMRACDGRKKLQDRMRMPGWRRAGTVRKLFPKNMVLFSCIQCFLTTKLRQIIHQYTDFSQCSFEVKGVGWSCSWYGEWRMKGRKVGGHWLLPASTFSSLLMTFCWRCCCFWRCWMLLLVEVLVLLVEPQFSCCSNTPHCSCCCWCCCRCRWWRSNENFSNYCGEPATRRRQHRVASGVKKERNKGIPAERKIMGQTNK